ncbi:hypothetical protein TWF569_002931 [Orbilia oligospora]|uniref:Uncharacterized protein n=1 Tax=Orbilia oligospora TaxID=2813651 RepID=A0A7C8JCW6_ORBOL|nr:hypothetical protein TWF706_007440 [Orbilia oligospora]KAF3111475.1 hypothetical protein TWF102_007139 [Orbilia oligospora]KAF3117302.1 hypothetical protein TWF103_007444 [Orbilia oligospora]KAF3140342.1 hypothetical protein TWF703_003215 [Orbilia oligospora]KAF3152626.1 hypothetical protein TWF569_002931 [Orbilia oligospora]
MLIRAFPSIIISILSIASISLQTPTPPRCAVEGALLPRPRNLCNHPAFKSATSKLSAYFNAAISGNISAGFNTINTSFAVAFVSLDHSNSANKPIYTYTHLSSANKEGTKEIDGDSQFLIGSISKLFSDVVLLKSGVDLDHKVTKYLPELRKKESLIRWEDVTLRDLGEHLAGMGPNYGFPEIYDLVSLYQQLGFPPVEKSDFPPCNVAGLNKACTRQQLLEGVTKIHPVTAVGERAVYSSLAFTLISLALQNATGKNYTTLLDELVVKPLKLKNTGASPGQTEKAVIPPVDNGWGADYGFTAPGGGLYSSINDLSALALSILNKSLLPPSTLRKWLKPTSSTPNLQYSVGLPWEIYRTTNLTPAHPHTIDIYAKDGGAYGYISRIGIIGQYGVGFVVLTAGDTEALYPIAEATVAMLIPAVEEAARGEATKYTGLFGGNEGNEGVLANFTVDNGPGVKLESLFRNGSDILEAIAKIWESQQVSLGPLSKDFRIYPMEVSISQGHGNHRIIKEDWRIAMEVTGEIGSDKKSELPSAGAFAKGCNTWQTYDLLQYGGQPIDRIVFWLDGTTREVVGVEVPFLRSGVLKQLEDEVVAKMERAN